MLRIKNVTIYFVVGHNNATNPNCTIRRYNRCNDANIGQTNKRVNKTSVAIHLSHCVSVGVWDFNARE